MEFRGSLEQVTMCQGPEGVAYTRFILVSSGPSLLPASNDA
jgi:hypothetical protein